jgi:hypothetical protein
MRVPQAWYDKGLLEDEPFLSAFKARQLANPPTRQGKDDDLSRNRAMADEIIGDKKLVSLPFHPRNKRLHRPQANTLQAWCDVAFQRHPDDTDKRRVMAGEPGIAALFVQFYWTLSRDFDAAAGILQRQRKRRGYGYVLSNPTQQRESLASTTDLTTYPTQTGISQIKNDVIDETKARPSQREDMSVNLVDRTLGGASRGQSPPKKVPGSVPRGLKFSKNLNAKKDMPEERDKKSFSQTCPSSLDPTSLSGPYQVELNSLTSPLPPDSQNTTAVCELPKTRKRRQTSPDSHCVKHQTTSDTSKLCNVSNTSISSHLAKMSIKPDNQVTNFEVVDNLKPQSQALSRPGDTSTLSCPPPASSSSQSTKFKFDKTAQPLPPNAPVLSIEDSRRHMPKGNSLHNGTVNGQSLDKRTESRDRVDGSQKKLKPPKNPSSNLQSKKEHLSQHCSLSVGPSLERAARYGSSKIDTKFNTSAFSSVMPAIHNSSDRGRYAATNRDPRPAKRTQGPPQNNRIVADEKAIDANNKSCNVPNDRCQIPDKTKKPGRYAGLHFTKNPKPSEGQGTAPQIPKSVLPSSSSSDQCNTSAICDPSNSRKRRSTSLDALEWENHAVPSQEVFAEGPEQAIMTSPRETKRRKVVQEEIMGEPGKDESLVPADKPSRGKKGSRTNKQRPPKVEPLNGFMTQDETHPAMGLPAINEILSHQLQDETSNPKRRRASSAEDRHHQRQEIPADQEDSVLLTVQPNPAKKRRGRPPKVKEYEQGSTSITMQLAPRKKVRSKALSSSQAQLNDGTVVPFSGQTVGMRQGTSISTCNSFTPAQQPGGVFWLQKNIEEGHDHALRSLDRDMKEELINLQENCWPAQEHNLTEENFTLDCEAPVMDDHPTDILPAQKLPLCVNPPIWAQVRDNTLRHNKMSSFISVQSRQEVCETFDWFRSYQGGVYFAHNTVKGYLLSAFSSKCVDIALCFAYRDLRQFTGGTGLNMAEGL